MQTVDVGELPVPGTVPLEDSIEKGYFAQEGLDVHMVPIASGTAGLAALASGHLDIVQSNWVSALLADYNAHDSHLRIVADAYIAQPLVYQVLRLPTTPIFQPKDLIGKTVGVNTPSDIAALALKARLQAYGVPLSSIKFRTVAFGQQSEFLAKGEVDAVATTEPYGTGMAQALGAMPVLDIFADNTGVSKLAISGYVAKSAYVQGHASVIAAFDRALAKGALDAASTGLDQSILPKLTGLSQQTVDVMHIGIFPTGIEEANIQRVAHLMCEFGVTKDEIQVAPLLVPAGKGPWSVPCVE